MRGAITVEATAVHLYRGCDSCGSYAEASSMRFPGAWLRPVAAPRSRGVSEWAEVTGGRSLLFAFAAQGGNAGGESIDGLATCS